jgi:hypothetical protein
VHQETLGALQIAARQRDSPEVIVDRAELATVRPISEETECFVERFAGGVVIAFFNLQRREVTQQARSFLLVSERSPQSQRFLCVLSARRKTALSPRYSGKTLQQLGCA